MANKQIYELTTRTFDGDCLVPFDTENTDPSTQAEKPYLSSKTSGDSLADFIANEEEYTNDLTTEDKTLTGAINELLVYALNIADEYDSTSTYDEGDFCLYEGVLYKCLVDISVAEAWDSTHWTSTLIVDNFGGGGGASVTLGTIVPSDASGSNGDLYVQYDGTSYAVIEYFVKINGSWRKSPYSRVVALTQAEYDLITPDPTTLYIITDAQGSYQTKTDNSLATTDKTVVGAINELNSDKVNSADVDNIITSDISLMRVTRLTGNLTTFSFTHPQLEVSGGLRRPVLIIGYNLFTSFIIAGNSANAEAIINMGSNTITVTKSVDSYTMNITLSQTSWGGVRIITFD